MTRRVTISITRREAIITRVLVRLAEQSERACLFGDMPRAAAISRIMGRIEYAAFGGACLGSLDGFDEPLVPLADTEEEHTP